jgi:hypothetical protein
LAYARPPTATTAMEIKNRQRITIRDTIEDGKIFFIGDNLFKA